MRVAGFALHTRQEPLALLEYEVEPGPADALVAVCGCGVCHTDLGFVDEGVPTRHELPLVLGHEVSGTVLEAPSHPQLVGRSVVVPAVLPCGDCPTCAAGRGEICRGQVFPGNDAHGGFASHLVVPARYLQPVDLEPGDELARLSVVADAVSTAYQAVDRSGLAEGDFAVFVGAGGVGGFGVQIAAARGARVLAIDLDDERLETLKGHGAEWTLNSRGRSVKEIRREVRDLAKSAGLAAHGWKLFETSGSGPGQELAFGLLTFGAYLGVVGFHPGQVTLKLSNLMAFDARAEGTWGCHPDRYPAALELVTSGAISLEPFVELLPMSQVNDVLDRLRSGQLKRRPVLLPDFNGSR
jgi:6-hydroxycyclohex-1-ene-1-carbonyl-CoA dehydrogenase